MNLKATLNPVQNLRAVQNVGGKGGSGSTTWDKVKDKPFETLGDDFTVENGELQLAAAPVSEVEWDDIQDKPEFATVATSGSYNDLSNTPTIPTVPSNVSAFNNDAGYITATALTPYVETSSLATVATTGDYNDLSNTPTIPVADGTTIIDNNGVWSAVGGGGSAVSITNTLGSGTAIGDLDIDGITTTIYAPSIPTNVSAFTNDAGYITDTALTPYITSTELSTALTPYVESSNLATVATSGSYSDLSNTPNIPSIAVAASLTTGVEVGTITLDGTTTTFYAPTPTVVAITNTLSTGTAIADIDIDGVTTTLYAPSSGSSVTIDNASLIDVGGVIQEAVPIYTENASITTTHNSVDTFTSSSYQDAGGYHVYYDSQSPYAQYLYTTAISASVPYTVTISRDVPVAGGGTETHISNETITLRQSSSAGHTIYSGEFTTVPGNPFYDDGIFGLQFQDGSFVSSGSYFRVNEYVNALADAATINWVVFEEIPYNSTYSSSDVDITTGQTIVHKLPSQYLDIDEDTLAVDGNGKLTTVIPPCPTTTDGTFTLQATVQNGVITYLWI